MIKLKETNRSLGPNVKRAHAKETLFYYPAISDQQAKKLNVVFKAGPLDLSFWSFLTFLHHNMEEVLEASSVKIL